MEDATNPQGDQSAQPAEPTGGQQPPANQGGQSAGDSGAQPSTGQPPAGGAQRATGQKDLSGIMEENVDISSLVAGAGDQGQKQQFISSVKIPAHPNTTFDEKRFVELLAGSISLTANEKKNIITAIPQLSQFQIDELMKIFEEEQQKFSELEKKHAEQVTDLEKKHKDSWQDVEAKAEEENKQVDEAKEAEDIKKSLGL